jgi:hypothetical protein
MVEKLPRKPTAELCCLADPDRFVEDFKKAYEINSGKYQPTMPESL